MPTSALGYVDVYIEKGKDRIGGPPPIFPNNCLCHKTQFDYWFEIVCFSHKESLLLQHIRIQIPPVWRDDVSASLTLKGRTINKQRPQVSVSCIYLI